MADKNWGIKIFFECGAKYYSMNMKENFVCQTCSAAHVPEDLNAKPSPVVTPKPEVKKTDELANIDDAPDDSSDDDIISLDDQKEIEESDEEKKPD
jgi:hypothetical protein